MSGALSRVLADDLGDWRAVTARYARADTRVAVRQLVTTIVPIVALFATGVVIGRSSWWVGVPIGVLNGLFLVRLFGLFHDCVHGSLFPTRRINVLVGHALGAMLVTPLHEWGRRHLLHHATSSDLDRRGWWDFWTMTVAEYRAASGPRRFAYRLLRHPFVMFTVLPISFFVVAQRLPERGARSRHVANVVVLDLVIGAGLVALWRTGGLEPVLVALVVPAMVSSTVGFWLFYVQHQFPAAHWTRSEDWTWLDAAFLGSSHLVLPRPLDWLTASLGYHHIHHLGPRIPNHRLAECHRANPGWPAPPTFGPWSGRVALSARLWDEQRGSMVSFRDLRPRGR